ncbi:MAG: DegT/DnrJ/EryC1/StrS family aminotransferase [Clostridia bacterium]|nr:DegT/DnrJ/EryC1/StrS family aminotransferase [Clostridia bacterium]
MEFKKFEKKIWLSTPTMHGEELKWMEKAYNSNWMSTIGENIDQVEKNAAEKVGAKYAVALSAGTAALHMAVKIAGVKPGEKVFCSDLTFAATVNPVVYEGGIPVFIDSEYETWNMDPLALRRAFELYPEVKKIVVVHLYGTPCKMDEIKAIADEYGAVIIEDAAESFGATYKGVQTGVLGNIGCISFNGNKIITGTCGGMLFTDDVEVATKVRKWSTQSREKADWYQHKDIGYNYRMSNVIAGVVRGQLPYLEEHIAKKKAIYERYEKGLKGLPVKMNPYLKQDSEPNFWLSCLLIDKDAMCEQNRGDLEVSYKTESGKTCPTEIFQTLSNYNVESRPIWKPMHMQEIFKNNSFVTKSGVAEDICADIFDRGLCLPSDVKMTEEQQDTIIEIIRSCFE